MTTTLSGVAISPVNMEDRKNLGLRAGDTVRVHQKIQDKGKTRIQMFEGLVLARKHGNESGATFTVRKVASGVGVEKIFPLYSPNIDKIEIVKRAKVRRAKLYYIREKVAREIRRQMRRMHLVTMATESEAEVKVRTEEKAKKAEEDAKAAEEKAKKVEENKVNVEGGEGPLGEKVATEADAQEETKVEEASEETPAVPADDEKEEVTEEAPVDEVKEETKVEETKEVTEGDEENAEGAGEEKKD